MSKPQVCAIGLDVGGTKIAAGIVALPSGQPLVKRAIPTGPLRGGEAVLADALHLATQLMDEASALDLEVIGIGIAVCELVDLEGRITSNHAVAWRGLAVESAFARLAPAVVESDVRAHALAEATFGAGQGYGQFVFVTAGTGISSCLVQAGHPYAGARGNALVLATSPLTTTCTVCGTVLRPVLEDLAAGPALVTRYNALAGAHAVRAEEVLAAAQAGDDDALEVVRSAGAALGVSLGWLVNVLDPEAIIVGGGLGSATGLYHDSLVAATRAHIWADASRDLPIVTARLGPEAGFIGAALTIAERVKNGR